MKYCTGYSDCTDEQRARGCAECVHDRITAELLHESRVRNKHARLNADENRAWEASHSLRYTGVLRDCLRVVLLAFVIYLLAFK